MSLTTMLLIKVVLGFAAMALACIICVTMENVIAQGKRLFPSVNSYRKRHFHDVH